MSYKVYELRDSESGSIDQSGLEAAEVWSIQKRYVIGQCPNGFYEAASAIAAYAPRYVRNPFGRVWRRKKLGIKGLGRQVFDITADYETLTPIAGEDAQQDEQSDENFVPGSIAWDTTGNTERRTQALEERVEGVSINMQGAVNVSGSSVQGVDVVVPGMRYSETWIMPLAIGLSYDYVAAVFDLTGRVNEEKFRAFKPGEALFLGARAQWSGDQPYVPVTFEWQCRPDDDKYEIKYTNDAGQSVASEVTKKGWEYVWVVYEPDSSGSKLVSLPKSYVFDKIYRSGDFSRLKITQKDPGRRVAGVQPTAAAAAPAGGLNPANNQG